MKRAFLATLSLFLFFLPFLAMGADALPDSAPVVRGLKDLLTVGSERAVKRGAKIDGYAGNKAIRIDLPDDLEHLPSRLVKFGFQAQLDAFVLSLNRAAEVSAPRAAGLFSVAIRETAFDDPRKILEEGDTGATDYFRKKSFDRLYKSFTPLVAAGMNEAGVFRAYREMMEKYEAESVASFPVDEWGFDLEGYVTEKALDGLFRMMGEEEKRIRKEPEARSTEPLRQVFR